ncbi:MAG TPA: hypothetical protein P5277_04120 [Candidatus Paceibacterota bacterium]|nr:hypothetical protein [Candidatus Paceibacterota bacterium]
MLNITNITNGKEVIANIPTDFSSFTGMITTIFKIIIGIAGVYFILWLISLFVSHRKNKILKKILKNVEDINNKLDLKLKK